MNRYPLDDRAIRALFGCLVWQAAADDGTPLDWLGYNRSDIPAGEQDVVVEDFREFCRRNDKDVRAYMAHTGRTLDDVAHDYVLTRNHHGAGFWDRCHCGDDDAADRLTKMCGPYGPLDLRVGDDGSLHIEKG